MVFKIIGVIAVIIGLMVLVFSAMSEKQVMTMIGVFVVLIGVAFYYIGHDINKMELLQEGRGEELILKIEESVGEQVTYYEKINPTLLRILTEENEYEVSIDDRGDIREIVYVTENQE